MILQTIFANIASSIALHYLKKNEKKIEKHIKTLKNKLKKTREKIAKRVSHNK